MMVRVECPICGDEFWIEAQVAEDYQEDGENTVMCSPCEIEYVVKYSD